MGDDGGCDDFTRRLYTQVRWKPPNRYPLDFDLLQIEHKRERNNNKKSDWWYRIIIITLLKRERSAEVVRVNMKNGQRCEMIGIYEIESSGRGEAGVGVAANKHWWINSSRRSRTLFYGDYIIRRLIETILIRRR